MKLMSMMCGNLHKKATRLMWETSPIGPTNDCLRSPVIGFGGCDCLVRNAHLLFERIQFRIVVHFPPFGADLVIAWLSYFPAVALFELPRRFLVRRRSGGGRPGVFRRGITTIRERYQPSAHPDQPINLVLYFIAHLRYPSPQIHRAIHAA